MLTPTVQAAEPIRIVLYSHDSQGLGHLRRNLVLAQALSARLPVLTGRAVTGLIITGLGGLAEGQTPQGFDIVSLPAIRKLEGGYSARHLYAGLPEVLRVRSAILSSTLASYAPDLVIIDRHPFGVDGELAPALHALREAQPQTKVVLGLREILDSPVRAAAEWDAAGVDRVAELFDEIWIYGDAAVHDLTKTGELPAALTGLSRFTGYLSAGRMPLSAATLSIPGGRDAPYVLTMAGGGSDGRELCLAAARAQAPPGYQHVVITGPQMSPAEHREVVRAGGPRTRVVESVPNAVGLVSGAAALVTMGGYNSIAEALSTQTPTLVVPRTHPRREQSIRALALAAVGAVEVLDSSEATAEAIAGWLRRRAGCRTRRDSIDLTGLAMVPRLANELLASSIPHTIRQVPSDVNAA